MKIHLLGASTLSGIAFRKNLETLNNELEIISYSRNTKFGKFLDLNNLEKSSISLDISEPSMIVSFAPIWLLSKFLFYLYGNHPEKFTFLKKIIVCSSSSVVSKRFAFSSYDKFLVSNLLIAENQINDLTSSLKIPTTFLRPAMIYGNVDGYKDKNISKILSLLRLLPIIFLPSQTGLRQPIHINQLSGVAIFYIKEYLNNSSKKENKFILIGGDKEITYKKMLLLLQNSLEKNDRGRKCIIVNIPNRLFYTILFPILWISPRFYEAILRISSNLSGYHKASEILKLSSYDFPIKPYF